MRRSLRPLTLIAAGVAAGAVVVSASAVTPTTPAPNAPRAGGEINAALATISGVPYDAMLDMRVDIEAVSANGTAMRLGADARATLTVESPRRVRVAGATPGGGFRLNMRDDSGASAVGSEPWRGMTSGERAMAETMFLPQRQRLFPTDTRILRALADGGVVVDTSTPGAPVPVRTYTAEADPSYLRTALEVALARSGVPAATRARMGSASAWSPAKVTIQVAPDGKLWRVSVTGTVTTVASALPKSGPGGVAIPGVTLTYTYAMHPYDIGTPQSVPAVRVPAARMGTGITPQRASEAVRRFLAAR